MENLVQGLGADTKSEVSRMDGNLDKDAFVWGGRGCLRLDQLLVAVWVANRIRSRRSLMRPVQGG